jgi:hypothetical protein
MRSVVSVLFNAVVFLWLGLAPSAAQVYYGTIRGTATDPSGAVFPNLAVTLTNLETNISQKVTTNAAGDYVAPSLMPGRYRVVAEQSGFKKFSAEDVQLVGTADYRVDIKLEVGSVTESVTVSAGAQLIETEKATYSDIKSREVFSTMPVVSNYRSIPRMLTLTPGYSDKGYYAAGSTGNNVTYTVDGMPIRSTGGGWLSNLLVYLDSYREFRVDLAGGNAASSSASQVGVVSETGTNELHGEVWIHYNTFGFYARSAFARDRAHGPPQFRRNFKVGGPAYLGRWYDGRNRTFWHVSYQGIRGSQQPTTANLTVPPTPFRGGDFSALSTQIKDPLTGQPFPGNIIPQNRISPVSKYFQDKFMPVANVGATSWVDTFVYPQLSEQLAFRGDHRITSKDTIFARYVHQPLIIENWDGGNNPLTGRYHQWRTQRTGVISDTHIVSPSVVNEARFGIGGDASEYGGPNGLELVQGSGLALPGVADVQGSPRMNISGYANLYRTNLNSYGTRTHQVQDTVYWSRGKHNFRFGAEIIRYRGYGTYTTSPGAVYGTYTFDGRFSGNPYADYLLGVMSSSARGTSVGIVRPVKINWEGFFQDDFKIAPRITLNYGVRYSLMDPGREESNLLANFIPELNALVVPDEQALSKVHPGFPKNVPLKTASSVGLGPSLMYRDKNNFAPRFGFAWSPAFWKNFVIRGGTGIYYVTVDPNVGDGGSAPYELNESFTNSIVSGKPAFAFPNPFPSTQYVLGGTGATGINPHVRTPYSLQYNFTMEKQVGDMGIALSYISTNYRQGIYGRDLNQVRADTTAYLVKRALVPFSYLQSVSYRENGSGHNYHGLMLKGERKAKNGLYYQTHLTWCKSMGDDWSGPEDAFNRKRDRTQGNQLAKFRAVMLGIWELPYGKNRRFGGSMPAALNHVIGNWNIAGTYILQSGTWLTPSYSGVDSSNTNRLSGRPDRIADGNLPAGQRTIDRWFDTTAFVAPPAGIGRFGTSGNDVLNGPGINVLHAGIFKEIVLHERLRMKVEAVATDALNHPNYNDPGSTLGSPSYGKITSTKQYDGNRETSFTVRLIF